MLWQYLAVLKLIRKQISLSSNIELGMKPGLDNSPNIKFQRTFEWAPLDLYHLAEMCQPDHIHSVSHPCEYVPHLAQGLLLPIGYSVISIIAWMMTVTMTVNNDC